jgi:hypothetical protein
MLKNEINLVFNMLIQREGAVIEIEDTGSIGIYCFKSR